MFKLDLGKAEESKMKDFCFIDYIKAFDYVNHHKLWKILKETGIPDHLTCFLKSWYTGQESTVRLELDIEKVREFQKKTSTSASLTTIKPLIV